MAKRTDISRTSNPEERVRQTEMRTGIVAADSPPLPTASPSAKAQADREVTGMAAELLGGANEGRVMQFIGDLKQLKDDLTTHVRADRYAGANIEWDNNRHPETTRKFLNAKDNILKVQYFVHRHLVRQVDEDNARVALHNHKSSNYTDFMTQSMPSVGRVLHLIALRHDGQTPVVRELGTTEPQDQWHMLWDIPANASITLPNHKHDLAKFDERLHLLSRMADVERLEVQSKDGVESPLPKGVEFKAHIKAVEKGWDEVIAPVLRKHQLLPERQVEAAPEAPEVPKESALAFTYKLKEGMVFQPNQSREVAFLKEKLELMNNTREVKFVKRDENGERITPEVPGIEIEATNRNPDKEVGLFVTVHFPSDAMRDKLKPALDAYVQERFSGRQL